MGGGRIRDAQARGGRGYMLVYEELGEGMTYDLDYANELAEATAMLVAKRTHLAYADVRALATE